MFPSIQLLYVNSADEKIKGIVNCDVLMIINRETYHAAEGDNINASDVALGAHSVNLLAPS